MIKDSIFRNARIFASFFAVFSLCTPAGAQYDDRLEVMMGQNLCSMGRGNIATKLVMVFNPQTYYNSDPGFGIRVIKAFQKGTRHVEILQADVLSYATKNCPNNFSKQEYAETLEYINELRAKQ